MMGLSTKGAHVQMVSLDLLALCTQLLLLRLNLTSLAPGSQQWSD
jgi:hypothetical protein